MSKVKCEVYDGLIPSERIVRIATVEGWNEEVPVSSQQVDRDTVEAAIIGARNGDVLIELPRESALREVAVVGCQQSHHREVRSLLILTDREIRVAIEQRQISINPEPTFDRYSSTSLDLLLDTRIRIWKPELTPEEQARVFCPGTRQFSYSDVVTRFSEQTQIGEDGYVLAPGVFLLAWTIEQIAIPIQSRLAARVEGKSSLARLGVGIHVTAPTIHAGFQGAIQLEICNHGPLYVRLAPRVPVCQLIFEQTFGTPSKGYQGQFFGQEAV